MLAELGLRAPDWGIAADADEAVAIANRIGYPVLVRPSYVLGGREMRICDDDASLRSGPVQPGSLVDRFVDDAIEVDVDAICDGERTVIGAIMEHVEEAGVHSGDSTCVIPAMSLGERVEDELRRQTAAIAEALGVRGLINVQFAVQGSAVYVHRGQPARVADGAVRLQGDRPRPGGGRLPGGARPRASTWSRARSSTRA